MTKHMNDDFAPSAAGLTKQSVENSRTAAAAVSEQAQASISLVPKLDRLPPWFTPIQADKAYLLGD